MILQKLLVIVFAFFTITLTAQNVRVDILNQNYSTVLVRNNAVETDNQGNIYTVGNFEGTSVFGGTALVSNGGSDIFIQKLDSLGNQIWVRQIGNSDNQEAIAVFVDDMGNIYTSGTYKGTLDFDPGAGIFTLMSSSNKTGFLQKMDANGNFLWAKRIKSSFYTFPRIIYGDNQGSLYIAGETFGTTDFDLDPITVFNVSTTGYDPFILKLDDNGNFIDVKVFSGSLNETLLDMEVDAFGNFYIIGNFGDLAGSTINLNPNPGNPQIFTSVGSHSDAYFAKYDAQLNFIWGRSIANTDPGSAIDIALDGLGNPYIAGYFKGTVDFDPGVNTYNMTATNASVTLSYDIYICKFDVNGNFVWAKQLEGNNDEYIAEIVADKEGHIYLTGYFEYNVDFDPDTSVFMLSTNGNNFDAFVQKMDTAGNRIWTHQIGNNSENDFGLDLAFNNKNQLIATGAFRNIVNFAFPPFNHNLVAYLGQDGYTILYCDATQSVITQMVCDSFTFNNQVFYNTGQYLVSSNSPIGCVDSILLDLTIIPTINDSISVTNDSILTAIATGFTYQWLDCNNGNMPISGATTQTFTASVNGSYAVAIDNGLCSIISNCIDVTGIDTITVIDTTSNTYRFPNTLPVTITPNPTHGIINIFIPNSRAIQIELFNLNGQLLQQIITTESKSVMNINTLPNGMYYLRLSDGNQVSTKKIIKIE